MKKIIILFCVVLLTAVFTITATADMHWSPEPGTDITFYGQARISTTYVDDNDLPGSGDKSDSSFDITNQANTRIGAKMKKGDLFGHWELGAPDGDVYTRLIYGIWTINPDMSLSIGKMYSAPYWWTNSVVLVDNAGIGYGAVYEGALTQLKLTIKGFYVSAATANTSDLIGSSDIDKSIPKLYAGYNYSSAEKKLTLHGGVAYNTYKMKNTAASFNDNVDSLIVYGHGDLGIGETAAVRFSGFYGQNAAEFGILGLNGRARQVAIGGSALSSSNVAAVVSGNSIEDTKTFAGFVEVRNTFGKYTAHAGYGYASSDNDASSWTKKDNHQEYWANVYVPLWTEKMGTTLFVVPEVHVFDEMDSKTGTEEPSSTYAGAKWQLNF